MYYNRLPNVRNKRLIDGTTLLPAQVISKTTSRVTVLAEDCPYKEILKNYLDLTRTITHKQNTHGVEHVIETSDPPVSAKARQLCPEKLKAVKGKFEYMVQQGLCRPRVLGQVLFILCRKRTGDWRPCGDYRKLNEITIPDRYSIPFLQDSTHFLHGKIIFSTIDLVRISINTCTGIRCP